MELSEFHTRLGVQEEKLKDFIIHNEQVKDYYDSDEESLFSINIDMEFETHEDRICVGVGKSSECNMDALVWTLNHAIIPSSFTLIYLIHVFPVIRVVPSPLGGMLPKTRASPKVVEAYLTKQRDKKNKFLQTYIDACSISALGSRVRVKTVLIESDSVSKAILDLIPNLNINRLVLGSTKSSLAKVKSKKGTASIILGSAPPKCDINIISKGKQLNDPPSWSTSPSPSVNSSSTQDDKDQEQPSEMKRSRSHSTAKAVQAMNVFKWI